MGSMSIMLLLVLALIAMQTAWPPAPDWLGTGGSLAATLLGLAVIFVVGSVYTSLCCRAMRAAPANRRQVLLRFHSRQKLYFMALLGYFLAALYLLGWGSTLKEFFTLDGTQIPGMMLVLLIPLLAILICSWACLYDVERTAHDLEAAERAEQSGGPAGSSSFPSRRSYLALQVRLNLLLIVPPLVVFMLLETSSWAFPELKNNKYFVGVFSTSILIMALLSMPWLLRVFLGLKPLPAGPLRDQLEAAARRLHFRCSGILLWNTRNSMANAMVTGLVPWGRFIVLTDRLLCELSPDEVEAVLGHEIGHVKHHHMFFYVLFLMGSLFALDLLWQTCEPYLSGWLADYQAYAAIPAVVGVALYLYVVFGYLSRNCERQADIYGCRAVSSEAFISALEKVAVLNGIPREKPGWLSSWRHPTIARRVEFLMRIAENPELEPRFQRRVGWAKLSLSLALVVALGGTVWLYWYVRAV